MAELTTSPLIKSYTLEEFWELPEPEDHSKLELIAGVLYMTPPPEHSHDRIVGRINRCLTRHLIEANDPGTIYVPRAAIWTGSHTYLEPDLFYVSEQLEAELDPEHRTTADLVIEVISPGSAVYDGNTKADTYKALGIRELWLIDETRETVEILSQTNSGYGPLHSFQKGQHLSSRVFPELTLLTDQIFTD